MTISPTATAPIKRATPFDAFQVVDTIVLAFSADPTARWIYPDPHQFLAEFPDFVEKFGGKAFEQGSAYYIDDFCGAALWLAPNQHPDEEAILAHIQSAVDPALQEEVLALFEQMDHYHPSQPHWYLSLIGVDPAYQRQGKGAALLTEALVQCDQDRLPAYLESSNPASIPLYQRHGFELQGKIQVGSSPPLFPMLRQPR